MYTTIKVNPASPKSIFTYNEIKDVGVYRCMTPDLVHRFIIVQRIGPKLDININTFEVFPADEYHKGHKFEKIKGSLIITWTNP